MSRNDYDDMPSTFSRRKKGGNRKTVLVSFMAVLVIIIAFLFYMLFKPSEDVRPISEPAVRSEMNLDVGEVVKVTVSKPETVVVPAEAEEEAVSLDDVPETVAEREEGEESIFTSYIVEPGDTLALIGSRFSISPSTIANVNRIADQTSLTSGQVLLIPPVDGQLYQVAEGDTLSSIMKRFGITTSQREFMELNGLGSEELEAGVSIFIPGGVSSPEESMFSRPGEGSAAYSFGEVVNGFKLEGVGFAMPAGSAVKAVADGFVSDAGNNERFGRFVTIIHPGGYKSSYYSLEVVNVKLGQSIKKGDVIGTVGSSTRFFPSATLYLILEQGAVKLDPMLFL